MTSDELRKSIEALLFVTDKPLLIAQIKEVCPVDIKQIHEALDAIRQLCDREGRGFRLTEVAGGFQFVTDSSVSETVKKFILAKEKRRLSQASLETLSIIAYRQNITRAEIEYVRGVNVDAAVRTLLEKGLVKITGKKDVPGHPALYGTTRFFLEHFGLKSLKDLPPLAEFTEKDIELPPNLRPSEEMDVDQIGEDADALLRQSAPAEETSEQTDSDPDVVSAGDANISEPEGSA